MPRRLTLLLTLLLLTISSQQFGVAAVIQTKAWLAPILVEKAWIESLSAGGQPVKPWPWADTWPVGRLVVPSLGVSRYVLHGDSGHALAFGPGHDPGSAALGTEGVAIVGGHRDTHFAFLGELVEGEAIELHLPDGQKQLYRIAETVVVDSSAGLLPVSEQAKQVLLITCYPFGSIRHQGPLRYVVRMLPKVDDPKVKRRRRVPV
jgi:sortase A